MSLGDKQRLFTLLIAKLIIWSYEHGYELTLGDAYRDPRSHGAFGVRGVYGRSTSNHKRRLAIDFNLFIDGEYQKTSEAYAAMGEYWESLHSLCSWGGRFDDGNHFSLLHDARR